MVTATLSLDADPASFVTETEYVPASDSITESMTSDSDV